VLLGGAIDRSCYQLCVLSELRDRLRAMPSVPFSDVPWS
jgi:hypothetical protein